MGAAIGNDKENADFYFNTASMKNWLRSRSLFPGISLLIFTLTLSLVVLMIVFPSEQNVTGSDPSTHNAFDAGRYPLSEGAPGSMSAIIKKPKAGYNGDTHSKTNDENSYLLSLTGAADTAGIALAIATRSKLGFYELYTFRELALPLSLLMHKKPLLLIPANGLLQNGLSEFPAYVGYVKKADTALLQAMMQEPPFSHLFPADARLAYRDHGGDRLEVFALRNRHSAVFSGEYIIEASSRRNMYNGQPQIVVSFADDAAADWEHLMNANKGRPLAACINSQVLATPMTETPVVDEGGSGK